MPRRLHRFHESRQSHFLTFSCYHRQPYFDSPALYDLFLQCLEETRRRFALPFTDMWSWPSTSTCCSANPNTLADAMRYLKLSFSKRVHSRRQVGGTGSILAEALL